jgi:hypothetical protein
MRVPRAISQFLVRAGLAVLTVALAAACSSSGSAAPAASGLPSSGPATTTPASAAAQVSCDTDPWGSAPVTVSHTVPVPPVPVVTAIKAAAHSECGYDRLVLSLSGKMPSYTIRYVGRVIADPSGKVVSLPGARYLVITLRPTQAHRDSGASTLGRTVSAPGFPRLVSYALAGDSEGVVTVAVGLSGTTGIRVGELPGRLFVDFKN